MIKTYLPSVADCVSADPLVASAVVAAQSAGTDITDQYLGMVGAAQPIGQIYIVPISAGLTASDTLYVTFTINKQTAAGGDVQIGTVVTKVTGGSGTWTKWVPVACTVSANATLAANDTLFVSTTHASTGTATPSFQVCIFPTVT
jgi:hypothetical protein